MAEARERTDGKLLCKCATQRGLPGARRTVEQQNTIQRYNGWIDMIQGKNEGRRRVVQQVRFDALVVHQTTMNWDNIKYWSHRG